MTSLTSRALFVRQILTESPVRLTKRQIAARMTEVSYASDAAAWTALGVKELRDAGLIDWDKFGFTLANDA